VSQELACPSVSDTVIEATIRAEELLRASSRAGDATEHMFARQLKSTRASKGLLATDYRSA
jgi:hypothetical protein